MSDSDILKKEFVIDKDSDEILSTIHPSHISTFINLGIRLAKEHSLYNTLFIMSDLRVNTAPTETITTSESRISNSVSMVSDNHMVRSVDPVVDASEKKAKYKTSFG